MAAGIAKLFGASVLLVRALPAFVDASEAARLATEATLPLRTRPAHHELFLLGHARALEGALDHRPRVRVREGEAASVILEAAEGGAGPALVAVGRRGLGKLDRLRLGSVSTRVLRAAKGAVLVCPSWRSGDRPIRGLVWQRGGRRVPPVSLDGREESCQPFGGSRGRLPIRPRLSLPPGVAGARRR